MRVTCLDVQGFGLSLRRSSSPDDPYNVYKGYCCRNFYTEVPDWEGVEALGDAGVIDTYIDKADPRLECRVYFAIPAPPQP